MKLSNLQKYFPQLSFSQDLEINSIQRSNQSFQQGDAFVAIKGNSWDGHSFLSNACEQAASLIVFESDFQVPASFKGGVLQTNDSREALDKLAYLFEGEVSKELFCVGITGTNGKTTTAYITENLLTGRTGVIGTINHHLEDYVWPTKLTSPGPIEFYQRLKDMKAKGADSVVMEISSHALDQKRMHSIDLDVAIFSNLSRDHLDYHSDLQDYFQAKSKLFHEILKNSCKKNKVAIINTDDVFGKKLFDSYNSNKISYGLSDQDINCKNIKMDFHKTEFEFHYKKEAISMEIPLIGKHNLYNFMASAGAVLHQDMMSLEDLQKKAQQLPHVPGRLECIEKEGKYFFVDYAHTEDALENVLQFVKEIGEQKDFNLITVFGCGGDRDKGKRPNMAKVAEKYSDIIIITSDNPRTEDPQAILNDVQSGFTAIKTVIEEIDRKTAIYKAYELAEEGDVIIVAGKGHEDYQEINGERFYFSDQEIIKNL